MQFDGFQWDGGNIDKCQNHGVSVAEIESLFAKRVLIVNDEANSDGERRYRAIGIATSGRYVFVVFTMRGGQVRPLSARYMHKQEIRRYEKDNPDFQER